MNSKAFTLSLIFAGIAMFMVYSYIESQETLMKNKYGKPITVVVAKADIGELELIDDSKVTTTSMPQNLAAPEVFTKAEDVYNTISTVSIIKGEQITKPRVQFPGEKTGLSRQVSTGKRAVSINVSEDQAVSKLLKPGDRVDVVALVDYAGGKKEFMKVKTILQDVPVLSTGLSVTNSIPLIGIKAPQEIRKLKLNTYATFNTVTLELAPFEMQKLIFLKESGGRLILTLRNNDDKQQVLVKSTRLFDVLGEDASEARSYFEAREKLQK